jgi:integrase
MIGKPAPILRLLPLALASETQMHRFGCGGYRGHAGHVVRSSGGETRRMATACASNTVHRWWYRMLEQAGLVGHGVRAGLNMHRARHTFATELRRVAGVEAASQALGHSDLSTTLGIYGHQDQGDLERAMEAFADAREAEDAASRGNDSPSRLD